jgi:hypothetical protein
MPSPARSIIPIRRASSAAVLAAAPLLLAGCAAPPESVPAPPPLALSLRGYAGEPFAGPTTLPDASPAVAMVRAEWSWMERCDLDTGHVHATRSLVSFAAPAPFAVAAPALAKVAVLTGHALADFTTALPRGDYGAVSAAAPQGGVVLTGSSLAFTAGLAHIEVHVTAAVGGGLRVALTGSEWPDHSSPVAMLEANLLVDGPPVGVVVPLSAPAGTTTRSALLCSLRATGAVPESLAAACRAALRRAAVLPEVQPGVGAAAAVALETLRDPATRRATLLRLATLDRVEAASGFTAEFVLYADAAALEALSSAANTALQGVAAAPLGHVLHCAALAYCAEHRERDDLAAELAGVAARHLGEVARSATALARAARMATLADCEAHVLEENRRALEDPAPAVRVRAHDWLVRRGVGVPTFEPLGERAQRRAALAEVAR